MRTMLSLILKDFRVGLNRRTFLLWFVFFLIVIPPPFFTAGFLSVIFISIVISLDEKTGIDTLYCSFPLNRSTYVLAKYLFSYAVLATTLLFEFFFRWLRGTLFFPDSHWEISSQGLFYFLFPLTMLFSIYFPVHFKIGGGVENSARFIVVVSLLSLAWITVVYLAIAGYIIDIFKIKYIYLYLSAIMILFAGVSLAFSIRFFSKRELA